MLKSISNDNCHKNIFFTIQLRLNKYLSKNHYNILIAGAGGITQPIALILAM